MKQTTIGVIGAGQMGQGIAQAFATAGFQVILNDIDRQAIDIGLQAILKSLTQLHTKALLTEPCEVILARINPHTELASLVKAQLVVEAVSENESLKMKLFTELDQLCPEQTILASNTSSISITRLAAATSRPDRVVGMHFMNPVALMKLVEIIRGLQTSNQTYQTIVGLVKQLDKSTVTSKDRPGFIVNRILLPTINEAIFTLSEGIASAEEIDTAMKLGANYPLGPLALADYIGLDTCLNIMEVLLKGFNDPKYRPCPLLIQLVDAGYLGRKSGRGFFEYS
ncbi:MAG: 3-hydroxyacyl-CoA dehydrogenase NAD-binding protein [Osedax symbiont Rs2]|nr:MAG: 3-hydroxyacyl-CoA dehydrogenase NAD-binding protein [Osedax symbiont Rs2]